jgi:hypothetical protein
MDPVETARHTLKLVEIYQEALAALTKRAGGTLIVDIGGSKAAGKLGVTIRDNVATFRFSR